MDQHVAHLTVGPHILRNKGKVQMAVEVNEAVRELSNKFGYEIIL